MNDEAQPKSKPTEKRTPLFDKLKNWWFQTFELAPPKEFEEWCQDHSLDKSTEEINLENFIKQLPSNQRTKEKIRKKFQEEITQKASNSSIRVILINHTDPIPYNFHFPLDQRKKVLSKLRKEQFNSILVRSHIPLEIKGAFIGEIKIRDLAKRSNFNFQDCCICSLDIEPSIYTDLNLNNCIVGTLKLGQASVNNLNIKSTWICSIDCPPTYYPNPFVGTITFDHVNLPTSMKRSKLFKGAQQYRNLRAHLLALQNAPAANLMHAKELASERETEKGLSKAFNWFYYLASNYGSRPAQPLIWILGFYLLLAGFNYYTDSGVVNIPEDFQGWQTSLKDPNPNAQTYRSLILPLQSMINPFGLFWTKTLIIPKTFGGQLVNSITGLLNDALLIFTITALRKRFKLTY